MNPEAEAMVGAVPDHLVAQVAGCSRDAVRYYREKLGIPAAPRRWRDQISDALARRIAALDPRRQEQVPSPKPMIHPLPILRAALAAPASTSEISRMTGLSPFVCRYHLPRIAVRSEASGVWRLR